MAYILKKINLKMATWLDFPGVFSACEAGKDKGTFFW